MKGSPVIVCCVALMIAACARETSTEQAGETASEPAGETAAGETAAEEPGAADEMAADETGALPCLAENARDGEAWINKMPGPGATPTLHVQFKVDARNGGDVFTLVFRAADRAMPPAYRYDLVRTSAGMLPAITEIAVSYQEPNFVEPELRAVIVSCDGAPLIEISPVEIVH
ncbi:MAG: hypothetical protein RIC52_18110 [Amphiplicatus sp.]